MHNKSAFTQHAYTSIALTAQNAANLSCRVAVIDVRMSFVSKRLAADRTNATLCQYDRVKVF